MTGKSLCAAKKRGGGTCARPAGWGTDHAGAGSCKLHGGGTPNGKKAAQRQQAERAVATYGLPREIDPHAALLEELHRTAGAVAWLGQRVAELPEDQVTHLIEGREMRFQGVAGQVETSNFIISETVSVWVQLYQQERKHLESVAKTCIACGIAERQVALAEGQGALMAQLLTAVLADLGVDPQAEETRTVVRRHLTGLAGGLAA